MTGFLQCRSESIRDAFHPFRFLPILRGIRRIKAKHRDGERPSRPALEVLGEAAASSEPNVRALDDPAPGQHDKPLVQVRALDNFDIIGDPVT